MPRRIAAFSMVFGLTVIAALLSAPPYQCADSTAPSGTDEKNKSSHNSSEKNAKAEWGLVIAAFLTLGFVAWQAYETRRSVQAASSNMELFISKERARLRVDLLDLNLERDIGIEYDAVKFKVSIFGSTAAYIIDSKCTAYAMPLTVIDDEETGEALLLPIHGLPTVIAADSEPLFLSRIFQFASDEDSEAIISDIKASRLFVSIRGFIKYKDVFDRERETRFRYVWKYEKGQRWGNWDKCGKEEENLET